MINVLEQFFTFCFALELLLRIISDGWTMVFQRKNHLDVFLVSLSVLVMWILEPANIEFAQMLRKLTVLRVMRLMRLAYKVRMRPEFKEMWALLKGLTESGETLFR